MGLQVVNTGRQCAWGPDKVAITNDGHATDCVRTWKVAPRLDGLWWGPWKTPRPLRRIFGPRFMPEVFENCGSILEFLNIEKGL